MQRLLDKINADCAVAYRDVTPEIILKRRARVFYKYFLLLYT